ncbi:hypothetical protein B0H14DRAFT_3442427 [Mycena olivaceomarginata]|nr:hypothetical protein B0H14DRAFT_3442427 [Mycena olivaceomarginata]
MSAHPHQYNASILIQALGEINKGTFDENSHEPSHPSAFLAGANTVLASLPAVRKAADAVEQMVGDIEDPDLTESDSDDEANKTKVEVYN